MRFDASGGVDHEYAYVAVLNGSDAAHDAIELQVFGHLVLSTYSGCVDEIEVEAELIESGIDTVACSTCYIGDYVPLFSDKSIHYARLTYVWTPDNGKSRNTLLYHIGLTFRQTYHHLVEQIAGARSCGSTDAEGVAKA